MIMQSLGYDTFLDNLVSQLSLCHICKDLRVYETLQNIFVL